MISDRTGNIVGKGENTSYQHFFLFPQYLQNTTVCQSAGGVIKSHLVTSLVQPVSVFVVGRFFYFGLF